MNNETVNMHFVPRFILKNFGEKIDIFNIKSNEFKEKVKLEKAFVEKNFYSNEIEEKLNKEVESSFAKLFNGKLKLEQKNIILSLSELQLIKKFLLISTLRAYDVSESLINKERTFYDRKREIYEKELNNNKLTKEQKDKIINNIVPFKEKIIENETPFDYWMRSLRVILDTDGTPFEIYKHPDKTYFAFRWAMIINSGYLAFWDANDRDEFVVTDMGMTSENEKGWDGILNHNIKKRKFLLDLFDDSKTDIERETIMHYINVLGDFHENFMMFPISGKRMIVEICPFYKFRELYKVYYKMPSLSELTILENEKLFSPNDAKYVNGNYIGQELKRNKNDEYIYEIKRLNAKETRYCNALFLDRINTFVGFSSLNNVAASFFDYKKRTDFPIIPRVNYDKMYDIISERYFSSVKRR